MARDPVCGMTVNEATAQLKAEHAGKWYYFCSQSCLNSFRANPTKFAV